LCVLVGFLPEQLLEAFFSLGSKHQNHLAAHLKTFWDMLSQIKLIELAKVFGREIATG
jgi:hypothetical protein